MTEPQEQERVVARFKNGRIEKGYSFGLDPSEKILRLIPAHRKGDAQEFPLHALKAIFFVRTFNGDSDRKKKRGFLDPVDAKAVRVRFRDGEILCGRRTEDHQGEFGFWMVPEDPKDNATRMYVPRGAACWVEVRDLRSKAESAVGVITEVSVSLGSTPPPPLDAPPKNAPAEPAPVAAPPPDVVPVAEPPPPADSFPPDPAQAFRQAPGGLPPPPVAEPYAQQGGSWDTPWQPQSGLQPPQPHLPEPVVDYPSSPPLDYDPFQAQTIPEPAESPFAAAPPVFAPPADQTGEFPAFDAMSLPSLAPDAGYLSYAPPGYPPGAGPDSYAPPYAAPPGMPPDAYAVPTMEYGHGSPPPSPYGPAPDYGNYGPPGYRPPSSGDVPAFVPSFAPTGAMPSLPPNFGQGELPAVGYPQPYLPPTGEVPAMGYPPPSGERPAMGYPQPYLPPTGEVPAMGYPPPSGERPAMGYPYPPEAPYAGPPTGEVPAMGYPYPDAPHNEPPHAGPGMGYPLDQATPGAYPYGPPTVEAPVNYPPPQAYGPGGYPAPRYPPSSGEVPPIGERPPIGYRAPTGDIPAMGYAPSTGDLPPIAYAPASLPPNRYPPSGHAAPPGYPPPTGDLPPPGYPPTTRERAAMIPPPTPDRVPLQHEAMYPPPPAPGPSPFAELRPAATASPPEPTMGFVQPPPAFAAMSPTQGAAFGQPPADSPQEAPADPFAVNPAPQGLPGGLPSFAAPADVEHRPQVHLRTPLPVPPPAVAAPQSELQPPPDPSQTGASVASPIAPVEPLEPLSAAAPPRHPASALPSADLPREEVVDTDIRAFLDEFGKARAASPQKYDEDSPTGRYMIMRKKKSLSSSDDE